MANPIPEVAPVTMQVFPVKVILAFQSREGIIFTICDRKIQAVQPGVTEGNHRRKAFDQALPMPGYSQ
jgi:hypothetical protein